MNKKTSIFYITTVGVAIACLILDLIFPKNTFSFLGICFALTMVVYGMCLIIRGFQFKIDSSLFLGVIIFAFGVISIMTYFTPWGYFDLWHYIFLGASLSSLVTGLHFKITAQKKLTVLFLGLFVFASLFQTVIYNWLVMLIIMLLWIIGFIIINNMLHNRRK